MNIQRATPVNEILAKLLFLIIPTALVGYFLVWNANNYFSILQNRAWEQSAYFLAGMVVSTLFYAFRFRFITTFAILAAGLYLVYKSLDSYAVGEFDTFFISVRFSIFAILFSFGWIVGAGFLRLRYWHIPIAGAFLCTAILLIAKQKTDTVEQLLRSFVPAVFYSIYIIFAAEQIYNYKDKSQQFWWFMFRRLTAFIVLVALLLGSVLYINRKEIKETVDNYGGNGKEGDNSMLKQNKDGTFNLKDYAQLRPRQGRNNELMFAAHIDNFFPGTDIPNPLYLTAFYYTRFDTLTETFERDATIPMNDLFEPNPSAIPLYSIRTDSSVIRNTMADKLRKVVEIEVYSKKLSPETYLAPHVGFFVQPITIERDFRKEFNRAFRAKGYVSELNSAYFIYNARDTQIRKFQQQRFDILRQVKGYEGTDKQFMRYYTYMPGDDKFRRISELAHQVTAKAATPVDKVLAIRDYFLSKNEAGEPLYSYTDNPGVPDIPSASKLMYFLFENHKGYCAYYAGATLFLLRSLGIPSRIAVGFLTVDRSDKNKGWYWYYADQAHAWVQVYFPGYGWLDFDTTVGNDGAQESPSPDGTPPMQPPHAWLAADGVVERVDTLKKLMTLRIGHILFHDKEYPVGQEPASVTFDVRIASVIRDSMDVALAEIQPGDSATAVSYAEELKKMEPGKPGESGLSILKRLATPVPTDDVYLKKKPMKAQEQQQQQKAPDKPMKTSAILWLAGSIAAVLLLLWMALPKMVQSYYLLRLRNARDSRKNIYWTYRYIQFYLHQLGYFRDGQTPLQYAREMDAIFGTQLGNFMVLYLQIKYSDKEPVTTESSRAANFLPDFRSKVRQHLSSGYRLKSFLRPLRTISYFTGENSQ